MNKYEIMFIVKSDLEEEARKNTVKTLEKTLTDNNATITLSKEKRKDKQHKQEIQQKNKQIQQKNQEIEKLKQQLTKQNQN